jgi:hypothetical protein
MNNAGWKDLIPSGVAVGSYRYGEGPEQIEEFVL